MKKYNLKRFLASLLAVLMLASVTGVSPAVFAEDTSYEKPTLQSGEAVVLSNADEATVKQVLAKALIANYDKCDPSTRDNLDWQYYCESEKHTFYRDYQNSWVSVMGERVKFGTAKHYDFKSLADNSIATYPVRLKGTETQVQFTKLEPKQISYEFNENVTVKIPYIDATNVDYTELEQRVLAAAVKSSTPELTLDNTSITYHATTKTAGITSTAWVPLNGGKNVVNYPAVSADNTYDVKLSFKGQGAYSAQDIELSVTFLGREAVPEIANKNITVDASFNEDLSINYDALRKAIWEQVSVGLPTNVKFEDVSFTYKFKYGIDYWPTFEGNLEIGSLDIPIPTLGLGENTVKLTWGGDKEYKSWEQEITVDVVDGRTPTSITFVDEPTVKISYNEDISVDMSALTENIWAIVNSITPSDISKDKITVLFDGKTLDKASITERSHTLTFNYAGSPTYKSFSTDVTVNFVGREAAFELISGVNQVDMKFKDATSYDYEATAKAIREAVVKKLAADESINLSDVTVEYNAAYVGTNFKPLDNKDIATKKLTADEEFTFRLSWGGNNGNGTALYKPFSAEVKLTLVDNRIASEIKVVSDPSITYNMNASEMEKAIFNSVINWDASELPAKDTLTADSFVIEYYATAQFEAGDTTTKLPDDIAHAWVPIGGLSKTVDLSFIGLGKIGIVYPQMGAGEQQIRIRFIGSADYKPSEVEAALSVAKADVKVNVKRPVIIMHAGDKDLPEGSITLTPDDKSIDVYTVFAGITSKIGGKVTTSVYLDLPDRYTTDNKLLTKVLDPLFKSVIGRTFTDVLQEGITVGELKQLAAKASEVADKLGKIGIDVESFTKLMDMIANLPGIVDDMRIAIGTPNHAGIYQAFVITNNVNYNTAYGTGTVLVLKQFNGISLVKNSAFDANGGKITVSQAAEIADSVCILSNDDGPLDNEAQGAVRYLFTGIKDSRGLYSGKTMPTEPGRYIVTATVVGGDFFAFPKTFSFTIVADPTPNT